MVEIATLMSMSCWKKLPHKCVCPNRTGGVDVADDGNNPVLESRAAPEARPSGEIGVAH